jgi:hypothetical protein
LTLLTTSDIFEALIGVGKRLSFLEKDPIMCRSLVVTLLFVILPTFSETQEVPPQRRITHEVVKGETLWELAERYLGNPFRWPLIHDANRAQVPDPDLIEIGQSLIIPGVGGAGAEVRGVAVVREGEVPAEREEVVEPAPAVRGQASGARPVERTVFYSALTERSESGSTLPRAMAGDPGTGVRSGGYAVPHGLVYAAEWLEAPGTQTPAVGTVGALLGVQISGTSRGSARVGEEVFINPADGTHVEVGDLLQSVRTGWSDRKLGTVQKPTGVLVVTEVDATEIKARVSSEYDRIRVGDRARPAPDYRPVPDDFPLPVSSSLSAVILGFSEERRIQGFGARAFLDVGADEGIEIGDLFRAHVGQPGPSFGLERARLQVVRVQGNLTTARVVSITHPGLAIGDRLRLVGKMR